MIFKKICSHFSVVTLIILSIVTIVPLSVNAQTGTGSIGLALSPDRGPVGTKVDVSLTIPNTDAYIYRDKKFSLVWDIDGWNQDKPADWYTIQTATWKIIGTATWDRSGHLNGVATIPPDAINQKGDHIIYAIYEIQGQSDIMNLWWGFFTVTEGSVTPSPTPTLTPTPTSPTSPIPTPIPGPTTIPAGYFKLTIYDTNQYNVKVNDQSIESSGTYVRWFAPGTQVKLYAEYIGGGGMVLKGWEWNNSQGSYLERSPTIYITMTEDITANPAQEPGQIPGFPLESIFIGLFLAIGLLYITRRKLPLNTPRPK